VTILSSSTSYDIPALMLKSAFVLLLNMICHAYCGNTVGASKCSALSQATPELDSGTNQFTCIVIILLFYNIVQKVERLLQLLDSVRPCCGNSDSPFLSLNSVHKGVMFDKLSKCKII